MKRKHPTHARRRNTTKARARLALLLVAVIAVAYAAVSTTSLAQTKKRTARTQPLKEVAVQSESSEESARAAGVSVPKRNGAERPSAGRGQGRRTKQREEDGDLRASNRGRERAEGRPREQRLRRGRPFDGDVRQLPQTRPEKVERPEREGHEPSPGFITPPGGKVAAEGARAPEGPSAPVAAAVAPAPNITFDGLDVAGGWAAGYPPDTVGDV